MNTKDLYIKKLEEFIKIQSELLEWGDVNFEDSEERNEYYALEKKHKLLDSELSQLKSDIEKESALGQEYRNQVIKEEEKPLTSKEIPDEFHDKEKETFLIELIKKYYNQGDDYYAYFTKKGKWVAGYSNDYPLQHGSGNSIILPDRIVTILMQDIGITTILNKISNNDLIQKDKTKQPVMEKEPALSAEQVLLKYFSENYLNDKSEDGGMWLKPHLINAMEEYRNLKHEDIIEITDDEYKKLMKALNPNYKRNYSK